MSDILKKIRGAGIAVAIAGGSLFAGSQVNRPECDFILVNSQQEEICITKEVKEAIESGLKPNKGFGGVQFNDKK